jgi:phosphoribosyl 1,2-cyclic phosphodiesterase
MLPAMRLVFLGTGPSGGTHGQGRSARLESSLLVSDGRALLIDVTRQFAVQAQRLGAIDAVLLTHGHRDACGGLPSLRRWWLEHGGSRPIDIFLSEASANVIRRRYQRLEHCRLRVTAAGRTRRVGSLAVRALTVPHSRDPRFPTYAWRVCTGTRSVVYASDVAYLTPELERFCAGATVLVLDGAMWRRRLFSHLTIDEALPAASSWPVDSIILTQIGRTAPPHPRLQREVAALCPKARPAYDGLAVTV